MRDPLAVLIPTPPWELQPGVYDQVVLDYYTETSGRFLDSPRHNMTSCFNKSKYFLEKHPRFKAQGIFFYRLRSIEDELAIKVYSRHTETKQRQHWGRVQGNNKPQMLTFQGLQTFQWLDPEHKIATHKILKKQATESQRQAGRKEYQKWPGMRKAGQREGWPGAGSYR